jgi:flagellar protein FlaG
MSVESVNASNVAASSVQTAATQQTQTKGVQPSEVNTQTAPSESVQPSQKMDAEEVQAMLDKMNEFMHNGQRNLNFSIDKDTDDMIVKVMDTQTQEVIRQFPSEETIKLAKHIEGMMGLILNDRA